MTTASGDEVIVGVGGSSHDFSCAVMIERDIRVAIEEERLSRVKHGISWWYENPIRRSMEYCLGEADVSIDEVDAIVSSDLAPFRIAAAYPHHRYIAYPHHACHAASVAMMLPPRDRAAVIVFDGMGSLKGDPVSGPWLPRETFSFFVADEGILRPIGQTVGHGFLEHTDFPMGVTNSVGYLYELITAAIGFHIDDAGKTMGLAAHGSPRFAEELAEFMSWGDGVARCFAFDPYDARFLATVSNILRQERASFEVRADLAASVQALFERTLIHCYRLIEHEDFSVLCLAGGCALNAAANYALAESLLPGRRLLVPPHVNDAGLAFGALALHAQTAKTRLTFRGHDVTPHVMRPGKAYDAKAVWAAIRRAYPRVTVQPLVAPARELAHRLASGQVIGVFSGRSEFGPRALGGRSILADPREIATRERINRRIKEREPFRPLAPVIRDSAFDEYFEPPACKNYFMTVVARAKSSCVAKAPAVVHVDGTARAQIVSRESDEFIYDVLGEFEGLTGIPMLLNTSFNRRGEPIVETPDDAIDSFLAMQLDGLLLGDVLVLRAD